MSKPFKKDYIKFILDNNLEEELKLATDSTYSKCKLTDLRDFCDKKGYIFVPSEAQPLDTSDLSDITDDKDLEKFDKTLEEKIKQLEAELNASSSSDDNDIPTVELPKPIIEPPVEEVKPIIEPIATPIIEPPKPVVSVAPPPTPFVEQKKKQEVPKKVPIEPKPVVKKRPITVDLSKIEVKQVKPQEYEFDEGIENRCKLYLQKYKTLNDKCNDMHFSSSKEKLQYIMAHVPGTSVDFYVKVGVRTALQSVETLPYISSLLDLEGFGDAIDKQSDSIDDLIDELLMKYADDVQSYMALGPEYRLALLLLCTVYATHTSNQSKKRSQASERILNHNIKKPQPPSFMPPRPPPVLQPTPPPMVQPTPPPVVPRPVEPIRPRPVVDNSSARFNPSFDVKPEVEINI